MFYQGSRNDLLFALLPSLTKVEISLLIYLRNYFVTPRKVPDENIIVSVTDSSVQASSQVPSRVAFIIPKEYTCFTAVIPAIKRVINFPSLLSLLLSARSLSPSA